MTPGSTHSSSFFRIHYPAPTHTSITTPPLWADSDCQEGLLRFMQTMAWDWPSWVNNSEFTLLPLAKKIFSPSSFLSTFSLGWSLIGKNLTIPICKDASIAQHAGSGWPVVVFSHGMGCNRFTMSQVCYQLASMGVVVVAVEHREGSGFSSSFKEGGNMEEIPHLHVPVDEHEYELRNNQVNHRCDEIDRAIDILAKLNAGESVTNVTENIDDENKLGLNIFKSSLDLTNNLYLMGHSFGGSTVLLSSNHPRVKAVLALDPWMFPISRQKLKIKKPTLVINTEKFVNQNNLKVIEEAFVNSSDVKFKLYKNGVHLSATDIPSVFTQTVLRKGLGFMDKVEPELVMVEINKMVWDWLRKLIN